MKEAFVAGKKLLNISQTDLFWIIQFWNNFVMVRIRVPVIDSANSYYKDLDEEPKKTINLQ